MAKTIEFDYNDTHYTLEFTRRTVKQMEKQGFVFSSIEEMPYSGIENLYRGSFLAHHPRITDETVNAIWKYLPNKDKFIGALGELYNEPFASLMDDENIEESKKLNWEQKG